MSSGLSPRGSIKKKKKQNKKKGKNMQKRKQPRSSPSKKKLSKKKQHPGQLQTNLSWGIAAILLSTIGLLFYYNWAQTTPLSIKYIDKKLDVSHLNAKYPSIITKYDHSSVEKSKLFIQSKQDKEAPIPMLFRANVVKQWQHDSSDFTQGFEVFYVDSSKLKLVILESTGLYKQSKLKYVELSADSQTPKVPKSVSLPDDYFGEGCTLYHDEQTKNKLIYQLTWKKRKVLIYDLEFNKVSEIDLPKEMKEGWGIYYDYLQKMFVATDGSSTIYFIEPNEFKVTKQLIVRYKNNDREGNDHKIIRLSNLNELEVVNGWILVNVWYNTNIYVVSPFNGFVYAIIECWKIFPNEVRRKSHAVLNGIAYDSVHNHLIITGKNWPKVFAIQLPEFMKTSP